MEYPDDYVLPSGTMKLQASPSISVQVGHLVETSHAAEGVPKELTQNPRKLDESMAWTYYPHLIGKWGVYDVWGHKKPIAIKESRLQIRKTSIAGQRQRTGLLTFRDIAQYFHLPIIEAAQKLQICTTALKKVCRKFHLNRWPHRRVLSSAKKIQNLKACLKDKDYDMTMRALLLLQIENQELENIYGVPVIDQAWEEY
ncbi:unnamed protein product [Spirodela intermedia]|uniref:RWP-RK domain-containing protein n=2 Tax=Spirodela intermedia TaxID=51605 RepID=A0A7I8IYN9_SPIIN|nr:unnamed protein product [Spirodela intermedia]CAA6662909.1 unnamed protein product [Spirodela intermedia]CAA7399327.1 unnamed protein product [Spirodela intermedia]